MIVNDKRLKETLFQVIRDCGTCPIEGENRCKTYPCPELKCVDLLIEWLQEFDVAEALEAGAHIINDQIIFPPELISNYATPRERRNVRDEKCFNCDECEYAFTCPYSN